MLTYDALGLPDGLGVTNASGLIAGQLTFDTAGVRTVTATVSDGEVTTSRTFTWTVTNVNRAPALTAVADQTSAENATITLPLVASDPDGTALTYSAIGLPASLSVNPATGLITGTLIYTSAGTYAVTATVSDGSTSSSRMFTWTVTNVNRLPVVTAIAGQTHAENEIVTLATAPDPMRNTDLQRDGLRTSAIHAPRRDHGPSYPCGRHRSPSRRRRDARRSQASMDGRM